MAVYNDTPIVARDSFGEHAALPQTIYALDPRKISGRAISSLVWAILAWTCLPILGALVALVVADRARSEIRASLAYLRGEGLAVAAIILASVQLLSVLILSMVLLLRLLFDLAF